MNRYPLTDLHGNTIGTIIVTEDVTFELLKTEPRLNLAYEFERGKLIRSFMLMIQQAEPAVPTMPTKKQSIEAQTLTPCSIHSEYDHHCRECLVRSFFNFIQVVENMEGE